MMIVGRYEEDDGHGEHSSSGGTAVKYVSQKKKGKCNRRGDVTAQLSGRKFTYLLYWLPCNTVRQWRLYPSTCAWNSRSFHRNADYMHAWRWDRDSDGGVIAEEIERERVPIYLSIDAYVGEL